MSRRIERFFHFRNYFWYNMLFWMILFLLETIQTFSFSNVFFENFDTQYLIRWPFAPYLTYWFLSLLVIQVYISTLKLKGWKFTSVHIGIGIFFGLLHKILHPLVGLLLERLILTQETFTISQIISSYNSTFYDFLSGTAIYFLMILIFQSLNYYRKHQEESRRSLELESNLKISELQWMKMQLNPHFLFNAFNTISMMVRNKKNKEAADMISDLSGMLRQSLTRETRQFLTLREEIEITQKYLNIESHRYKDRVEIQWDIDDTLLEHPVPSMILQPIVENAFKHGISNSMKKEIVRISAKTKEHLLLLSVFNTGSGLNTGWDFQKSKGIGLSNTSNRLSNIYQQDSRLLIDESEEGITIIIQLPLNNR